MHLRERLSLWLGRNQLKRRLHPAPTVAFRLRRYEPRDRAAVVELHDRNAPDRLPPNHRPTFEAFIDSGCVSFFVAESPAGEVLACGGVTDYGDHAHTLMYGLVAPEHQGRRIGATLALARLALASRAPGGHLALIHAVPKSLGYYQRFGFAAYGTWTEDGVAYPSAVMRYPRSDLREVELTLAQRGHLLDPTWPVERNPTMTSRSQRMFWGEHYVTLHPLEGSEPPPG
ncbi:MAG: GNAT family N-acetyltransferase [Verrucomicrobia bacterium]|nr:GNAT family N-acetyltransferase [Verrucomicrobiota bacterium]